MASYSTSFQCPDTGLWIIASYAFGKLTIQTPVDDLLDKLIEQGESTPEDVTRVRAATAAYCERHSGHRFRSLQEANEYVRRASDGQMTFGLERD